MKKLLFLILASLSSFSYAEEVQDSKINLESQENPKEEFSVNVVLTPSSADSFFAMRAQDIFFVNAKRAFRHEEIRFLPLFVVDLGAEGGDYKIECSITVTKLDTGEKESQSQVLLDKYIIEGKQGAGAYTIFFPKEAFFSFSDTDEYGIHRMDCVAKNLSTGEVAISQNDIDFAKWETLKEEPTAEEISSFIFSYNTHLDKQTAYATLLSKGLSFYKKGGLNGFDSILLSYYSHLFSSNKFLMDILLKDFPSMAEHSRRNVIMLNAYMNNEPFKEELLSRQDLIFQNYMEEEFVFNLTPYDGKLPSEFDIDALWGEFFALGNIRPIIRIMEFFEHPEAAAYAKDVLSKNKPNPLTKEERENFELGRLYLISANYIQAYINNPILRRYILWAIENTTSENLKTLLLSFFPKAD